MHSHTSNAERRGFTLAELLVVITVIVLLFTVVAPNFNAMISAGIEDSAVSVISAATATARVYATRTQSFSAGSYQGAALLFTPSGEVRVVHHIEAAADGLGQRLVDKSPPKAGYADLPGEDFFTLPEAVSVVGITRGSNAGIGSGAANLFVMTPPFAVRFNSHGTLISRRTAKGDASNMAMYYDGDGNTQYVLGNQRASGYNPNLYDPRTSQYVSSNFVGGKIRFGIDGIDTVVAVIAYKALDLANANVDGDNNPLNDLTGIVPAGQLKASVATWIIDNGRTIYFNRYTGTAISP